MTERKKRILQAVSVMAAALAATLPLLPIDVSLRAALMGFAIGISFVLSIKLYAERCS